MHYFGALVLRKNKRWQNLCTPTTTKTTAAHKTTMKMFKGENL